MTEKIRKMLSLILAFALLMLVFVPSFAEEAEDELFDTDDEELYSFDDDYCGYADSDVIAEHVTEMTEELIFADDYSEIAAAEPAAEPVAEEPVA